jgi:predicted RNase H-like HicB family nuclease
MGSHYSIDVEQDGSWFVGSCSEVPGANGQGRSREECRSNLLEAISLLTGDYSLSISGKGVASREFSQLAELHVAGLLAEAGWRIYLPHRDDGFDFVALKCLETATLIRPVQVKGKYPTLGKLDKATYGFVGKLTQTHPEMILAVPYFEAGSIPSIRHVAFMPLCMVRPHSKGWRTAPAKLVGGRASIRGDHARFFDQQGLSRPSDPGWSTQQLGVEDE